MVARKLPIEIIDGIGFTQCLHEICQAYTEYAIVAEQEKTKRRAIEAWETEAIARIETQRDVMLRYLERSFDERAKQFDNLFKLADRALSEKDNKALSEILESIQTVATHSPLQALSSVESVQAALDDPEHLWEF